MPDMTKPAYFELDGKYAMMIPTEDGGVTVAVSPPYSIADYMERGKQITFNELPKSSQKIVEKYLSTANRTVEQES